MELKQEKIGNVLAISISGRVEINTAPKLKQNVMGPIESGERQLLVDLSGLEYISSSGLGVLLHAAKTLEKQKGSVMLCALKPHIKEVFQICGFTKIFPLYETREEALKAAGE
jgi:anti-anti-sigma factor